MPLTLTQTLMGTKIDGSPSEVVYPCRINGDVRRTIGLQGDNVEVIVQREEGEEVWPPADWDITRPITLTFGLLASSPLDPEEDSQLVRLVTYLVQDTAVNFGVDAGTAGAVGGAGTSVAQERMLLLCTALGVFEDGRGGRLRYTTLNPLLEDGSIDTGSDDYFAHSDLVLMCVTAMGFEVGDVDASIDDEDPPGPLDWGNANPKHELDALLARIGYAAVVGYHTEDVSVFRLPKAGEALDPPAWITENAEPFTLTQARAVRGKTIIVTSGRTRTIEVETFDGSKIEWVWRDPKTGRWLNDAQTASLYPGTTRPGNIGDLRLGAAGAGTAARAQAARSFRHFRVADAGIFAATRRLVALPITALEGEDEEFTRAAALIRARGAIDIGQGQWRSDPEDPEAFTRVDGVRIYPLDGVFEIPRGWRPVRMPEGKTTSVIGNAQVITAAEDFFVTFAHEAANGVITEDYYVRGFTAAVDEMSGLVVLTALDAGGLAGVIDDPMAVWIEAPFLQRVVERDGATVTPVNDTELDAIAEKIASIRAAGDLATAGVVEVRGIHDKVPGRDWAWASSIAWDLARMRTIVTVGSHEVPQGLYDAMEREAGRSLAAGLSRFNRGGSSAAAGDVVHGAGHGSAWDEYRRLYGL